MHDDDTGISHGFLGKKMIGFLEVPGPRFPREPGTHGVLSPTFMADPFSLSIPISFFCQDSFICYTIQTEVVLSNSQYHR